MRGLRGQAEQAFVCPSPSERPYRGVLVATGRRLSPLAHWIVFDFDLFTIRKVTTRSVEDGTMILVQRGRIDPISADDLRAAIRVANAVWSNCGTLRD